MAIPSITDLTNVAFRAMIALEKDITTKKIHNELIHLLEIDDEELNQIERGRQTVLEYRLSRAMGYLKSNGLIEKDNDNYWIFTEKGKFLAATDAQHVRNKNRNSSSEKEQNKKPYEVQSTSQQDNQQSQAEDNYIDGKTVDENQTSRYTTDDKPDMADISLENRGGDMKGHARHGHTYVNQLPIVSTRVIATPVIPTKESRLSTPRIHSRIVETVDDIVQSIRDALVPERPYYARSKRRK
jgi:hypothetical protein